MAQQEEPLYDFPEPTQPSERKFVGHQRGQGSLRSVSVLDRLLLTVPVWFQPLINPATSLHILQREPPGTFMVRKSRTSQRNVLCVRLADDSLPSFVQQFGIREEHSTLTLETSAISFPDLPRLISFYCVSRDVLPFPLELPEAIAKATSHKELESISHMGIEFWNSHLNVRGPREAPKPQKDQEKRPDIMTPALPAAPNPLTNATAQPNSNPPPDSDHQTHTDPESDSKQSGSNPTLFHEFCPITTRSPRELDCGSGLGALCFINPLFLQSQSVFSRKRLLKRSLKVRVSTETSTLLSPPLAPPPPPPLMPKTRGKCKALKQVQRVAQKGHPGQVSPMVPTPQNAQLHSLTRTQDPQAGTVSVQPVMQEQLEPARVQLEEATTQLPTGMEHLPDSSDYMHPSPITTSSLTLPLSPYVPAPLSPMAPSLFPKVSPHVSPCASPALSPYQSPSPSPITPLSLSLRDSPSISPSVSPYQSPSSSPKVPFSLSPFTSPSLSQLQEEAYHIPPARPKAREVGGGEEDDETEKLHKGMEEGQQGLLLQINAISLHDIDNCISSSSQGEAAETQPHSPHLQGNTTSL
ncbi:uncharacterized protein ACBR49_010038 [Aulostomus maculatus]